MSRRIAYITLDIRAGKVHFKPQPPDAKTEDLETRLAAAPNEMVILSQGTTLDVTAYENALEYFSLYLAWSMGSAGIILLLSWLMIREIFIWARGGAGFIFICVGLTIIGFPNANENLLIIASSNILVWIGHWLIFRILIIGKKNKIFEHISLSIFLMSIVFLAYTLLMDNSYNNRVLTSSFFITALTSVTLISKYRSTCVRKEVTLENKLNFLVSLLIIFYLIVNTILSFLRGASAAATEHFATNNLPFWDNLFFTWNLIAMPIIAIGVFLSGILQMVNKLNSIINRQMMTAKHLEQSLRSQIELKKVLIHEVRRPIIAIDAITRNSAHIRKFHNLDDVKKITNILKSLFIFSESLAEVDGIITATESYRPSKTLISDLAKDLTKSFEIKVVNKAESKSAFVLIDPILFEIAIGNLVDNAWKYGKDAAPQISISIEKDFANFDVVDGGDGFPEKDSSRAFRLFWRGENKNISKHEGSGVGLYLAKIIAEAHGGNCLILNVTSRQVVWLFLEQLWFEFVPFLHRLQGRLAAQG